MILPLPRRTPLPPPNPAKTELEYFAPEPASKAPLRELSVLDQMYGYYDAA